MTDCLWQELASISVEPPTGVNQSGATARRETLNLDSVETRSKGLMTVHLHFCLITVTQRCIFDSILVTVTQGMRADDAVSEGGKAYCIIGGVY